MIEQTQAKANAEAARLRARQPSYAEKTGLSDTVATVIAKLRNDVSHISTTVGDIHIHMPAGTKADPNTLSVALRQRLLHQGLIPPANTALQ